MATDQSTEGGGVSGFGIAEEEEKPLGGTGGAAGAGTRAGEGRPAGEGIGVDRTEGPGTDFAAPEEREDHDQTPALGYGEGDRPRGPTIGEALGSGVGTHVGTGPAATDGGIGGGVPEDEEGNGTPAGTRSPGQDT